MKNLLVDKLKEKESEYDNMLKDFQNQLLEKEEIKQNLIKTEN